MLRSSTRVGDDAVEPHAGRVAVARVARQLEAVVLPPALERERAVRDDVPRPDPGVAPALDRLPRHRQPRRAGEQVQEVRHRPRQPHDERGVVGGGEPERAPCRRAAEGLGPGDHVQQAGVARGGGGGEHAPPRPDEVARGERRAVAPGEPRPQVERPGQPVAARLPARGLPGARLERARIRHGEPLEQGAGDAPVRLARHERRVDGLGLVAVVEAQHVLARHAHAAEVARSGIVTRRAAARQGEGESEGQPGDTRRMPQDSMGSPVRPAADWTGGGRTS